MTARGHIDVRVRALLASASELALRQPDDALRMFAEAASLGELTGCAGVAQAFEAMGRLAAACGDFVIAREALEQAEREATEIGDALVLARSRATLAVISRARPYASSAEAFAAELRHAADLLDAAQIARSPVPALHASRARLELRRRLATSNGLPALGRVEVALALTAVEVAVFMVCASLTLELDVDRLLPPAAMQTRSATWDAVIAAWLAPGFDATIDVESVLATLVMRGLIVRGAAGRPMLAPDVETLLTGRTHPVLPEGFHRATGAPTWREGPAIVPLGPAQPPRVLVITGTAVATTDHAAQLAWAHGWPLWLARVSTDSPSFQRGIRAVVREALVHDRLLGLSIHGLDQETTRLMLVEATSQLDRLIVLAHQRPELPDALAVIELVAAPVVAA